MSIALNWFLALSCYKWNDQISYLNCICWNYIIEVVGIYYYVFGLFRGLIKNHILRIFLNLLMKTIRHFLFSIQNKNNLYGKFLCSAIQCEKKTSFVHSFWLICIFNLSENNNYENQTIVLLTLLLGNWVVHFCLIQ